MKILVTGAAGFIGSVVAAQFIDEGHEVVALDNLLYGHRPAVHPKAKFVHLDLLNETGVRQLFHEERFDAVAHLAGEAYIDESLRDPGRFFRANVTAGLHLIEAMRSFGVNRLVFSSTAAVYGQPKSIPIQEDAPKEPCNSYGESKLAFEKMLSWHRVAYDLRYVCLRYFNACGATERFGESRQKETHLIPICFEAALGQRERLSLFGTDYPTPDGTCLRDYVHVSDIAQAHVLCLNNIDKIEERAYNLGNARTYSNLEVIKTVEKVTGLPVKFVPAERRPGDPAVLEASSERIREELNWSPKYSDLESMVASAWEWRSRNPKGYNR